MSRFLPYGHQRIGKDDIKAVSKTLESDWITQGPKIQEFEEKLARYCGARYALGVSSGTSALHLAFLVSGLSRGDEVVTSPLTFAATSNTIVHCGAKPVFADVQEDTLNIDPEEIEKKITRKTKALAVVDFAGHPCDFREIKKIARKHKLLVIGDAAHSLGAKYRGKKAGSLSDLTVLSFHPVKAITTGEGGAVLTDKKDLYLKMKRLRHHGIVKKPEKGSWYYEIEEPGYNYRITDFQCALGISQLKKIDRFLKRRREIVKKYDKAFEGMKEIIRPAERKYVKSAWHIYPVRLRSKNRRKVFENLRKQGIGVQVHYLPLHLHSFYKKKFGYKKGDFPVAEKYYEKALTLPLFPGMADGDISRVVKIFKRTLNQ